MNDDPPLIEDHSNNSKFSCSTIQSLRGLRFWESTIKEIPLACGVGLHGLRHIIFVPVLDANGNN